MSFPKTSFFIERRAEGIFILLFVFLAVGVITAGYVSFRNYETQYREELSNRLSSIADLKVSELLQYRKERLGDASIFGENPSFSTLVKRTLDSSSDMDGRSQLRAWLEKVQAHYQYDRVFLLDAAGEQRLSVPEEKEPVAANVARRVSEILRSRQVVLEDFYRNEHDGQIYLSVLVPILGPQANDRVIAVLVLRIDPHQYLYPLLQRWPTPSASAETLLVRRDGDDVLFLNELRFLRNAALDLRRPLSDTQLPAAQAVLGQEGIVEGIDYRGEPVIAALRAIPNSPWFLVARMDQSEVYAPIFERLWGMVILVAALVIGIGASAGYLWRQRNAQFYREKYEAAERLRALSARQEALLAAVPDIVMEVDGNKHYVWANHAGLEFFGDDVLGKEAGYYFEGEQNVYDIMQSLFNGDEQVFYVESWQRRKDGIARLLAWWCRALKNDQGVVTGALSSARDITEQQASQEALRESEERFREMAEQLVDVLFVTDLEGHIDYVSPSARFVFGWESYEMEGRVFTDFLAENDIPRALEAFQEEMRLGTPVRELAMEMRRKDGRVFVGEVSSTVMTRDGKIRGAIGLIRDVTERKRNELALKKQIVALTQPLDSSAPINFSDIFNIEDIQRIQDAFASATNVASLILQPDGAPITRPSNFCRMCDIIRNTDKGAANCRCSDTVIGKHNPDGPIVQPCLSGGLWDAGASITVGDRHIASWLVGQVRNEAQNEAQILEYAKEIGADPEEFREALAEVPVMSREQFEKVTEVLFLVANELSLRAYQNVQQARFIAEREHAVQERVHLETQLRQAQKMEAVGQLAGGIAHDFNNLLQIILGNMELLSEEIPADSPCREQLGDSQAAAERAVSLTRQLLAFSRRQVLDPKPLDLNAVISDVMKMIQRVLGEHIELNIIPGHSLATVRVDRAQIEQVLINLCVNARDAMPEGGMLTIETENVVFDADYCKTHAWANPGRYVLLRVTDSGCGMPPEIIDRIFDPFFTTKETGRGTGLGLATVYGIVRQHDGMIQVYSELDHGSTFKIYLPAVERSAAAVERGAPEPVRGGTERILMAEDDAQIRGLARRILENAGYRVTLTANGEEALQAYRENNGAFDLLLLDVVMPRKGGRAVLDEIRRQRPDMPCLFASGYSDNAVHTNFILEEGLHLLQKPYQRDSLLRAVRRVLDE